MTTPDCVILRIVPLPTLLHTTSLLVGIDYDDIWEQEACRSRFSNFLGSVRLIMDYSAVGTRWQVRNVPAFPAWLTAQPKRSLFLLRQSLFALWQYVLMDFVGHQLTHSERAMNDFTMILQDPTARHAWPVETAINLGIWFVLARVSLDFRYRFISVALVALGVSPAENWPPMFGSTLQAYTLRNFWGTYWHQTLRWPLTATSAFITRTLLKLPYPSLIERYSNLLLAFLVSGIIHLSAQYKGFITTPPGAIHFFTSFTLAIMAEDGIQAIWARMAGEDKTVQKFSTRLPTLWKRLVGYIWVTMWLTLLGPLYSYDMAYMAVMEPLPLPVSVTEYLTPPVSGALLGGGMIVGLVAFGAEP
ncbi:toxin biosynthesis protein Tri7-like protein [Penicillium canescens]|uniref:Toxin biosynthesis protein Tri7-like protein n=1 Tax=Penicillium canescens TaxID=5083 RepID=A0AAD6I1E2_PENCN|nr:toxin biosynthesis protein Tri7-like protein [Penicillium canescens]KAJ6009304.1 toxin biosynthesis protein Tri7-like protein [Penicillium canescens]KAJ6027186.1 toxin biosynthesis protein Tri7-like protein [Penicillium canescens]KAJ6040468.1 toxin biosynthesis protein Tri7-like protein [Penicillium canescens]KAJ6067176.1 toxin biosynthesis protein Tri7-like protein [Penicillium canescens]